MKKRLKHFRSKSPSDSDVTNTANPYAEENSGHSGRTHNPYAIGSNPYNSVPSYYSRNGFSPRAGTPLGGATSVMGSSVVNSESPPTAGGNPYDLSALPSQMPSSSSRRMTRPTAPASDSTESLPYGNPYANISSTSTNLQRQELLGLQSVVSDENVVRQQRDYDPSIMETEAERDARHAAGRKHKQGQKYGLSEQSPYEPIEEQEQQQEQQQEQDQEDLEINALKQQIRHTNKQSLASADNALRYAEEAEASGLRTLQSLGEQGDQLAGAENSIAVTGNQTKLAEDYAAELKALNRSIFAVHVSNPFNSRRRIMEQEQKIRATFRAQQVDRETTRRQQYDAQQRVAAAIGNVPGDRRREMTATERRYREQMHVNRTKLAETSKYLFEPEEEDFETERELESRLDSIGSAATRLNMMAKSIGTEVTEQNERVHRLGRRTDEVEVGVHMNTVRLARIIR
ncbi:hypothetical protein V1525DRAFT_398346 [Lipomyces kononenkoae]|uniref:Uncharacterized protein n=1 Tax=Lipomyces kononenkoae TaxID=34357 RepID=A0ACC3T761_LIPKO